MAHCVSYIHYTPSPPPPRKKCPAPRSGFFLAGVARPQPRLQPHAGHGPAQEKARLRRSLPREHAEPVGRRRPAAARGCDRARLLRPVAEIEEERGRESRLGEGGGIDGG